MFQFVPELSQAMVFQPTNLFMGQASSQVEFGAPVFQQPGFTPSFTEGSFGFKPSESGNFQNLSKQD